MFSSLIAKVLAGAVAALMLALVVMYLSMSASISDRDRQLKKERENNQILRQDNQTLRSNQATLQSGLDQCNAGVANVKAVTDALTKAGIAAVDQVKAAGARSTRDAAAILAMPRATCDDAMAILKAGGN